MCHVFFVILYCMMTIMKCVYSRMYYSVCPCVCPSACPAQRVPVSNSITVLGSSVAGKPHHGSYIYYYYNYYYYSEYDHCCVCVLWSRLWGSVCLQCFHQTPTTKKSVHTLLLYRRFLIQKIYFSAMNLFRNHLHVLPWTDAAFRWRSWARHWTLNAL